MESLCISSLNSRGLRNKVKRKSVFHKLKQNKYDIICVQESYVSDLDIDQWEREWGGKIYHCSNTNHSSGQMIMCRKHLPYETECITASHRILIINIKFEKDSLFVINAYGPNNKNEKYNFFKQLQTEIEKLPHRNWILCGDFNTVLDNDLDIISGGQHHEQDIGLFQKLVQDVQSTDLWRVSHGDAKDFTWSRKTPFIARRLDFIFVPDEYIDKCAQCEIVSMAQTDHRLVYMKYRLTSVVRGPSYWKFNDSLIQDQAFVNIMNNLIENYIADNADLEPQMKWDLCKVKIRELCIAYSKDKTHNNKTQSKALNKELNETDERLAQEPHNETLLIKREQIKHKLELLEINKAKSAQVRSREKYIAEGEKNTRYFLSLEKMRSNMKIIEKLEMENGDTITTQEDILKEQVSFYSNVFSKKADFSKVKAEQFVNDLNIPQISNEQKEDLEAEITEAEILKAIKSMKNNTAPGLDGLTSSFIKFFWIKLKPLILHSFKDAYLKGEMSESQKKAVITLIHKGKDLTRTELKNYRPISLINTDAKILAKCLAHRLTTVIGDLVHEDQVGFIKGRKASSIIRLIDDVIDHMNDTNSQGLILALDYARAFDSISKDFVIWSFEKFGFGANFINWVKVITANTTSCINNSGWISEEFPADSGIRQGCPFSPMTFVLALELLAIKIRSDQTIQGIHLPQVPSLNAELVHIIKLALYADDITMFLRNKQDLQNALNIVNKFSEISQLNINRNKTEAMWIGSSKNNRTDTEEIKFKRQLKILGIIFQNDTTASNINENWTKRLTNIERIISLWSKRNLSISGKLCIIKSFLISQLVYPMQALCAPEPILFKLNTLLFKFLWQKRFSNKKAFEKVKRTVICNTREEGGLGMINMMDMQSSFMLGWVTQIQSDSSERWKCIPLHHLNKLGRNLVCLRASTLSKDMKGLELIKSSFWKIALTKWADYKHTLMNEQVTFLEQPLWNNIKLLYKKNTLFCKKWIDANLTVVRDVWSNGNILPLESITEKTGFYVSLIFDYNALRTALVAAANRLNNAQDNTSAITSPLMTPKAWRELITMNKTTVPCAVQFWLHRYNYTIDNNDWTIAHKSTKEERLKLLHWKIIHNIYPTNILLNKMKLKDTNKCNDCNNIDFIEHFFWSCPKLKTFWQTVTCSIARNTGTQISLTEKEVLLGYKSQEVTEQVKTINHYLLVAKMSISKYKYGERLDPACIFEKELQIRHLKF